MFTQNPSDSLYGKIRALLLELWEDGVEEGGFEGGGFGFFGF